MNNRKLRFTVLSILVLVIMSLAIFTSCKKDKNNDGGSNNTGNNGGSSSSSAEIYIEKSLQPKLLYVEGQDLDLSKGALTIAKGSDITRIPFTDSRISISGYDKHTLGNQTLTVSYDGKTTTLTVAVIARMTVENVETEYFTGEAFNKNKGRIKIAKDDATTSYVDMKSNLITVKNFNNTTAGTVNVTIQYTNGSASYECSFPVTFYAPDKIDFKKPNKQTYMSHEEKLNFSGGYLYLEAAKPSTFKKSISITDDMVSGYDPGIVTEANKDEALKQVITVTYAGREWTFDVSVLYSPVFVIEGLADKIKNIDLELKEGQEVIDIKISDEAGEAAKEAIQRYLKLSDKSLVDNNLIVDFARIAAWYVNIHDYTANLNALSNAFVITETNFIYTGKTYEDVKNAIDILEDPTSDYNKAATLMREINTEFGTEQFNSTYTIAHLTSPITDDDVEKMVMSLQHIINVYDLLKDMPDTWETELKTSAKSFAENYGKMITDTVYVISSSDFKGSQYSNLYAVIIRWRKDFFDIIYSYYYYAKEGGKEQIYADLWEKVPAPGLLEDFHNALNNAYNFSYQLTEEHKKSPGNVRGADLYVFHYYYRQTLDLANQIKASGNELYITIYNVLELDQYIEIYLNAPSVNLLGYYDFIGPLADSAKAKNVLDAYYKVIEIYATTGEIAGTAENRVKMVNFFNALFDLTPAELHWFLSSICFNYHGYAGNILLFNPNNVRRSWLSQISYGFFWAELPKSTTEGQLHASQAALANLLQAMEIYATSQYNTEAIAEFKKYIETAAEQLILLTTEEREKFDNLVGDVWDRYYDIYTSLSNQSFTLPEGMDAKFEELYQILDEFNAVLLNPDKQKLPTAYPYLMALYQQAKAIYDEIYTASLTNSQVKKALYSKIYEFVDLGEEGTEDDEIWQFSIDSYYYYIKSVAFGSMLPNGHVGYVNNISSLLLELLPLFRAEFADTLYTGGDLDTLIEKVRALKDDARSGFNMINADLIFYAAVNRYSKTTYEDQNVLNPGAAAEKIDELLALIKEYIEVYSKSTQKDNPDNYQEAYPLMIAIYMKAKNVYDEILALANGDDAIKLALNYKLYTMVVNEETSEATVDEYYTYVSFVTYRLIASSSVTYDAAQDPAVEAILIKILPLLRAEFKDELYTGADIIELLAAVRALTPAEKYNFYIIQGNLGFYSGLEKYLHANLSEAAQNSKIVSYLFNAEIYYSLYELDSNDEDAVDTFKQAMENAIKAYASLTAEDKALLDDLYYNGLLAKYNTLFPAENVA